MTPPELPYVATDVFLQAYDTMSDRDADLLDPQLDALLKGGYRISRFRRDRVQGEVGGAFIVSVRTLHDTVWHIYWDFTGPRQSEIVLIALIEIDER